jgi:glycerol uptake facilitator-like aquaporin
MFLAKGFLGTLPWKDCLALMVADLIGAFLGGIFVFLTYLGHFLLVPHPPRPRTWVDQYERRRPPPPSETRDALVSAGDVPISFVVGKVGGRGENLAGSIAPPSSSIDGGREEERGTTTTSSTIEEGSSVQLRRRNTIQVATQLHLHDVENDPAYINNAAIKGDKIIEQRAVHKNYPLLCLISPTEEGPLLHCTTQVDSSAASLKSQTLRERNGTILNSDKEDAAALERAGLGEDEIAAYLGELESDRKGKLSCFCTRPALRHRGINFLTEVLGTFILIFAALMMEEVGKLQPSEIAVAIWEIMLPFFLGWLVVALVMSQAGPTGYAANPARDMGPRLAHWVLPIPNKGSSEFSYSWVPVLGPFLGGFLGSFAFYLMSLMIIYPNPDLAPGAGDGYSFGGTWS